MDKKRRIGKLVDDKIKGIEIVLLVISLILLSLAPLNAYRISTTLYGLHYEQYLLYESLVIYVLVTVLAIYLGVIIKYMKQKHVRAYVILRLFPPIVIMLYSMLYLIGLNIGDQFEYSIIGPNWVFITFNLLFMGLHIYVYVKIFYSEKSMITKYRILINTYTVLLTMLYMSLLSIVIINSALELGASAWH